MNKNLKNNNNKKMAIAKNSDFNSVYVYTQNSNGH